VLQLGQAVLFLLDHEQTKLCYWKLFATRAKNEAALLTLMAPKNIFAMKDSASGVYRSRLPQVQALTHCMTVETMKRISKPAADLLQWLNAAVAYLLA
jgi:hypothetical protein